jgi:NAD(P)-dependent dehydrogenase (short-subunit alcohol dehydrogenase family)
MNEIFDLTDHVIVVTGATGALAGSSADYLAAQGARMVYIGRSADKLDAAVNRCRKAAPAVQRWGRLDGLINGAGGNMPGATLPPDKSFFDLDFEAFRQVVDLNLHGTVLTSLVFAPAMSQDAGGSIINFSSVSAPQAVTRVAGYSAAKAGVENFTQWLAVDLARRTGGKVRVNAVRPGFFLGKQNHKLLTNEDGSPTERGQLIIRNTPFGRFGKVDELHGAIHYLLADASRFVTGTTLTVDGGFCAFSGV